LPFDAPIVLFVGENGTGESTLHARSHREAFLAVMQHRMASGMFILDEPEAALSPQRQMAFATLVDERVRRGGVQVIMATHSPLLMTIPDARILLFDGKTTRRPLPRRHRTGRSPRPRWPTRARSGGRLASWADSDVSGDAVGSAVRRCTTRVTEPGTRRHPARLHS